MSGFAQGLAARAQITDTSRIWKPQPCTKCAGNKVLDTDITCDHCDGTGLGPQGRLLAAHEVRDIFFGGARGGGKTDGLLGDWLEHQKKWGGHARGVIFRRTFPELEEVHARAVELFEQLGARYLVGKRTWLFPNGARLKERFLQHDKDADKYQGHQYTWIAIDEMGSFPRPDPVDKLRACLRSAHGVTCVFRASGNPGGVGHNWMKLRYVDPSVAGRPFTVTFGAGTIQRLFIPSRLEDNAILTMSNPEYWLNIEAATEGKEWLLKAWRFGLWDITAGGMFDDIWVRQKHCIAPFVVPSGWRKDRSFDWGSSKPFSVGWWAESDGVTPATITLPGGAAQQRVFPRGSLFRIAEWYGSTGKPDVGQRMEASDVGKGIAQREKVMREKYGFIFGAGPADPAIYTRDGGPSKADELAMGGATFVPANSKRGKNDTKGIRQTGWDKMRKMLRSSVSGEGAGLYVFNTCTDFVRTVPVLVRDERDPDDVDTSAEDHIADEVRYRIMGARQDATPVDVDI